MNELKELYKDTWAKAARDTRDTIEAVQSWFPWVHWRIGKGALSDQETNDLHDTAEPDIILLYDGEPYLGIEVTGSDKISFPCDVWIGHHKVKYARSCGYPVVYVLYYNGKDGERVITQDMLELYAKDPIALRPRGIEEKYHVVKPHHTNPFKALKLHVESALIEAEREFRIGEETLADLFGAGY